MVRFLVHHATTVVILALSMLLFGYVSYASLPRENTPDIKIPIVLVSTPYIGVSPADVEGLVTIKLEAELASLTDVKKMTSSSAEGLSIIAIEFEPEVDIDDALQKVRDRVSRAAPKIPEDAEDPIVQEINFSNFPILLVTLSGGADEVGLKQIAERLQDKLKRVGGVLDAELTGGRERQLRVQVDPARLAYYGLSLDDVMGAVASENVNIPGGTITSGRGTFLVRTPTEFTTAAQIERIAVKRVGDRPVMLSDVGRVLDDFEDRATYSRMDGTPSVTLAVKKRTGANILAVASEVKALVAAEAAGWPAGVHHAVLSDQSTDIELMVSDLENNIIASLILVVLVVLVFMGLRSAFFVSLTIPLSMLGSFLVLDALDFTLNTVVLFSLVLALGMLVDNGIVVIENIYRHYEMGKDRMRAAIEGTEEVFWPVLGSTATTVAAFFPLVFWSGILGQFMGYLPKTVIIVLSMSFFAAVLVLPVFASRMLPERKVGTLVPEAEVGDDGLMLEELAPVERSSLGRSMRAYYDFLSFSIDHRYLALVATAAMWVGTLFAYGALQHGVDFFPAIPPERAIVGIRLPEGADLEATDGIVRQVEEGLRGAPNVESWVASVGVAADGDPLSGTQAKANEARITVNFFPPIDKQQADDKPQVENTFRTIEGMRARFADVVGARVTVEPEEFGPPVGKPISVEVSGEDFHVVGEAANALMRKISEIPGTADLSNDYRVGRPELRLRIDRAAAKRVGASSQAIGSTVRTALAGTKASALRAGEDEYDIVVEVQPESKLDLQQILNLRIPGREDTSPSTFPVPLAAVASYTLAGGAGTIQHLDQDLVITIQGDVNPGFNENEVREQLQAVIDGWEAPPGVFARQGGAADEQAETEAFMAWAFALALVLVFAVMVAQFDDVLVPGIIMATVVLSLIGVLWGLILTGTAFGIIMTGLGVISLAGVVVNNGIVLLDFVIQLRARGLPLREALLKSGVTRFRPVMLTAGTTVLGLVPMAVGMSIDFFSGKVLFGTSSGMWWGPMAVAVVFGMVFATVLTLVVVPTMFAVLEDLRGLLGRLRPRAATAGLVVAVLAVPKAEAVTLEEAWAAAEQNNVQLLVAREQAVQAATYRWQGLSAVLPKLSASASFAVNQQEVELDMLGDIDPSTIPPPFDELFGGTGEPIIVQPKQAWSANFSVYQPLLSGQAFPAWQAATQVASAARLDVERAQDQVRGGVARAYYGLAVARASVALQQTALQTAKHQVELAARQVAAGLADRRVSLQAELGVARAERDLRTANEQVVAAEVGFARATGLPGNTAVELPAPVTVPGDVEASVQAALSARPDLAAAQARVSAAKYERTARDLEWMPTVGLTFTEIYNQVPGFVPEHFQWRLGLDFQWQVFDGGLRVFRSKEYASRTRAAQLLVTQGQQVIEEEVRVAWERFQRAETSLGSVDAEISLATESLRLAETAFTAGQATWLDVDQARLSLEAARLGQLNQRMDRDLAAIDLLIATGRL